MARPHRIHAPGAMHHVTLRGNHQQDVFFCAADYRRLDQLMADSLEKSGARLHAYCYMTNHIHVLVQVGTVPLGRVVMPVASQYARQTQKGLGTTGHFFERRYHSVLVDADSYFMELLRYIHLNPVAAGIVRTPDAYPWSSHHAYLGTRRDPWLTTDFGLSLFAAEERAAIDAYRRFIDDGLAAGNRRSPFDDLNHSDRRILGSDDFARRLLGSGWRPRSRKSLDDLIAEACLRFNVTPDMLCAPARATRLVAARAWIVKEAVEGRIASISAVARRLNRDESSMRHALAAVREG
jgi:REP element-mobilizing transposase RayT